MAIVSTQLVEKVRSFEEFLKLVGDQKAELVDGNVVWMSPTNSRHATLTTWLTSLFMGLLDEIGGMVFADSFAMRSVNDVTFRCPDIMVVLPGRLDRLEKRRLNGPADLIVEVVSPDSLGRDRGEKFGEYESVGVSEYWIIDPDRRVAEFYQLEEGRYRLIQPEGRYASKVLPQVKIDPQWFWQERLPKVRAVLKEWGIE